VFVWIWVRETKGMTLEDMNADTAAESRPVRS